MRRVMALIAASVMVLALGASPVTANNDPHRVFFGSDPFILDDSFCDVPVSMEFPVVKEYAKVATLPDGSTTYRVTGALQAVVTNTVTGSSLKVTASGPGSMTFSGDGTMFYAQGSGLWLIYAPNLTDLGFPSNVVVTAGPITVTQVIADAPAWATISGHPHLVTDVCAALS